MRDQRGARHLRRGVTWRTAFVAAAGPGSRGRPIAVVIDTPVAATAAAVTTAAAASTCPTRQCDVRYAATSPRARERVGGVASLPDRRARQPQLRRRVGWQAWLDGLRDVQTRILTISQRHDVAVLAAAAHNVARARAVARLERALALTPLPGFHGEHRTRARVASALERDGIGARARVRGRRTEAQRHVRAVRVTDARHRTRRRASVAHSGARAPRPRDEVVGRAGLQTALALDLPDARRLAVAGVDHATAVTDAESIAELHAAAART
mmetsp:Transcript_784/g.2358  ORF Transcript_784/g.2358 Transcript_784/m.2358 type:complete len:269 (-) Transcript_784:7160-7966(-)